MSGPWDDFASPTPPAPPARAPQRRSVTQRATTTGQAYDGDTARLDTGENARVLGYDAFELKQNALDPSGVLVPIGEQSRAALLPYLRGGTFTANGTQSYGRPVGSLDQSGEDPALDLLRQGYGLAAPEYLRADPARTAAYMEAERLARLNGLGAHGNTFATPQAYRQGEGEPWADAEFSDRPVANGSAVFADDPTPFQGLRPEIAAGYLALTNDPNSTVDQIVGYADANNFKVDRKDVERFVRNRDKGVKTAGDVEYKRAPRVLTDPGDGTFGATMRGVGDPLNVLDELGAVVDSLGGTDGRENIQNSDRRWADIWTNNLEQNRSVLAKDDAEHPYARFGGQLASGLAIPGASIEGVGLNAARGVLRAGGTRMAAVEAAEAAVRGRIATAGAIEGGAIGAGGAEGGFVERAKGAVIGAPLGAGLGFGTAALAQRGRDFIRGLRSRFGVASDDAATGAREVLQDGSAPAARVAGEAEPVAPAAPAVADEVADAPAGPWDDFTAATDDVADMANDTPRPTLDGPRVPDRIDVTPPRPLLADAPDAERLAAAERLNPRDVLPVPSNTVRDMDEAAGIERGRYDPVRAPDERAALERRNLP